MKKLIISGIGVIACVALCAAVWPRNSEVGDLSAEPVKTAVTAEIEARSEKTPQILTSEDKPAPIVKAVTESNSPETKVTAEKETQKPAPAQTA